MIRYVAPNSDHRYPVNDGHNDTAFENALSLYTELISEAHINGYWQNLIITGIYPQIKTLTETELFSLIQVT